jgi:hypothetical protein
MAWRGDLMPCDYFGAEFAPFLRAVGWLERGHPYRTGEVDRRVFDRLTELCADPWQPMLMGTHRPPSSAARYWSARRCARWPT